jgi:hypothetical protein
MPRRRNAKKGYWPGVPVMKRKERRLIPTPATISAAPSSTGRWVVGRHRDRRAIGCQQDPGHLDYPEAAVDRLPAEKRIGMITGSGLESVQDGRLHNYH